MYQVYEISKGTYGDNAFGCSTVYWWYDAFVKEGRTSAKLKGEPGAPTMKLIEVLVNTAASSFRKIYA